jgi:predicted membrane-bound spermidine synthase
VSSAVEYLRTAPEGKYDAIIVDSSDPIGELFMFGFLIFIKLVSAHFSYLIFCAFAETFHRACTRVGRETVL